MITKRSKNLKERSGDDAKKDQHNRRDLAIAFDPYTHGYYRVGERVGEAFKDGLRLKK